jgi:hypothetical protein
MLPDYLSIVQEVLRDANLPKASKLAFIAGFIFRIRLIYPSFNAAAFINGCGYFEGKEEFIQFIEGK